MAVHDFRNTRFTPEQGRLLVRLARNTIAKTLGKPLSHEDELEKQLAGPPFDKKCGAFVTLNKNHQLRGCIGSLSSNASVSQGVRDNALNAAFHDPRFSSLSKDELDDVTIEVSVLTEPEPLSYENAADLVSKLRPRVHGVILSKGYARATFLPQVWEQLPKPEDFLSHLCRKAGLSENEWKKSRLEVSTYQVEYFEEE
ncbi:MAG: AmmeMemoRadiSam system protein A [Proteobacteria bacterium]|nr:AmmeMemoRadiSam system protein A [Pseudomonadota bacterium]MBU4471762.1 AmmeMemoRadiSam system protein A [Pseudomonadota bacterium]MCG2750543.1 AmmeMemoRadiSam system protein A [Desulfobacteraceae bacterium]